MMVERPVAPQAPTQVQVQAHPAPLSANPPLTTPLVSAAQTGSPSTPLVLSSGRTNRWQAEHELARHQAETERIKVLVDFLARPVCAPGGAEPDPDIVTAYNLAVEAALTCVRRASQSLPG